MLESDAITFSVNIWYWWLHKFQFVTLVVGKLVF